MTHEKADRPGEVVKPRPDDPPSIWGLRVSGDTAGVVTFDRDSAVLPPTFPLALNDQELAILGSDRYILLWSMTTWRSLEQRFVASQADSDHGQTFVGLVQASIETATVDGNRRIRIPHTLLERVGLYDSVARLVLPEDQLDVWPARLMPLPT